ncbi:hypothetical protein B0H65DRAFT_246266 [Neurospora tetraspora]|uniref:Zn(2)-C6 fungal-type domain-containing protein n=1 Tax=Neurospora tetraspora TaxID=94610 RepID=A0AAE0JEG2_9PEZI|nr:hypothetical protein B0H65DRAFT_246266 [Neurospora tetraspora]
MPGRLGARHRGPRLGYTKSRTGCLRCKQRRVKCDENKPCKACQRHGVLCSLVMAGETGASGSTAGPNSTGSTSWRAGSGSGSGSGPGTIPTTGSGGTSSLIAPFNTGPTSGPGFRPISGPISGPLNPFRPITGSASNPIGPSGTGPASGSGPGSGQNFLPISGTAPAYGSGSGPGSGCGRTILPIPGTAPASGPGSFLPQTGSAGNPFTPASSAYSKSPAGFHQAFGSGIHMSNQDSRHSSASASHDETNFNALPTANRHTPMAIQSLTNPPYPTPPSVEVTGPSPAGLYSPTSPAWQLPLPNNFPGTSSHLSAGASQSPTPQSRSRHPYPLRPSPMSTEPSKRNTPDDPFPYLTQALTNPKFRFLDSPSDSDLASQVFAAPDFELFDHYVDITYGTLTRGVHEHIWKIEVPKLAFSHPFLMHNLLSTAAFYLAYTEQDEEKRKKWATDGSKHFNLAVTGMREVLRKEGVTPENCHAVFASSSLLFIGDLADKGPFFNPADDIAQGVTKCPLIDELLGVFRVVKGIGGIVGAQEALLREGPVGGLFNAEPSGEDHPNMERLLMQLKGLYQRVASITSRRPGVFLPPTKLEDTPRPSNLPKENQTILSEITAMEDSIQFALTKSKTPEQSIIAVWPINMTDDFMRLLQKSNVPPQQHAPQPSTSASSSSTLPPPGGRNPIALALLGYYCCVMKETERECWFTKGWAEAVIKEVIAELEEMAGVTTNTSGNGSGSTASEVQGGHHDQGQTMVNRPVWREWARREWLEDAKWARKWIMTKQEEMPKPTTFSEDPMADMDATLMSTQGQRPGADAPKVTKGSVGSSQAGRNQWSRQWATMMDTQGQQPGADATMMDTQGQQLGADAPMMESQGQQQDAPVIETQGQQPGVPEPAPTTSSDHSDVPMTGTQGQQPGADAPVTDTQGQQPGADAPVTDTQGQQPGADATMMDTQGQQPGADAPMMESQGQQQDAPVIETQGQQPGVPKPAPTTTSDVPMTGTQGQQPGVPEPAPTTSSHSSDVPMTGTQGQQPGVPEAQAATGAS